MSIQNNSAGLQRILQAVNSLPEGGGATVQTVTGTAQAEQTINCGFKPDLVTFRNNEAGEDGWYHPAFAFTALNTDSILAQAEVMDGFFYFGVTRTATGFTVDWINKFDFNFEYVEGTHSFSYVAVKYT